jgi:hypothetical protein
VQTNLHSSVYSANKAQIEETVTQYADYYAAIKGATITDYEVLDNGVTVTTFSNGVVAYTNPTKAAQTCDGGEPLLLMLRAEDGQAYVLRPERDVAPTYLNIMVDRLLPKLQFVYDF